MTLELGLANHPWVAAVGALHGAALLVSAPAALRRNRRWLLAGLALLVVALLVNTGVLAARWIEAGRPPFKTLFETMVFYPWCLGLVTLALVTGRKLFVLVPFAAGASLAGVIYALCKPDVETVLLPPALQSAWFIPHVVTYFVSYAALFASGALAIIALRSRARAARSGGQAAADRDGATVAWEGHAHFAAVFGVGALTFGLVMGSVWGKYAWGDYWGWDPKESWALVTWLAYMIYLHLRLMDGWHGRRAMTLLALSFAAVVFTYLGMHLLPTAQDSMHVYQ